LTAALTTPDQTPESSSDDELAPRLSRLGALRSAWGVLAPAGLTCDADPIGEAGRALTDRISTIMNSRSDITPAALLRIDTLLVEFETSIRHVATSLHVSQLRAALPAYRETDRKGLLDLLDISLGEDLGERNSVSDRIGSVDYLITLLCTSNRQGSAGIVHDPVTLTPRLARLCESADEPENSRLEDVEAEFFAAANLHPAALQEELQQRNLRSRKVELGSAFFAPRILRAIVTYNAALFAHVSDKIMDSGDWGVLEKQAPNASKEIAETQSVFKSKPLGMLADAVRRRAEEGSPEPTPIDRIAWALDFEYLEPNEEKALRSPAFGSAEDPLGMAILLGLLCRSIAVLSIDLQDAGLSPDEITDRWVSEVSEVFQGEINRNLADDAYKVACALSELKNKFLLAPLADHTREERAARREEPTPVLAEQKGQAEGFVRDALEQDQARTQSRSRRRVMRNVRWAQIGQLATLAAVIGTAVVLFAFEKNGDLDGLGKEQLAAVSPYLENGKRNGAGTGNAFVGRVSDAWLALPAGQRSEVAEDIVARLRSQGMQQIMIYDDDKRVRIQALGQQPIRTL
jgi:hypothetical protein